MADDDLDDFELEKTRRLDEETVRSPRGDRPGDAPREGIGFPMILTALAVLVFAMLGVLFLVFRKPGKPVPTPAPIAAPMAQAPATTPTPATVLPRLEDSDGFVRGIAAALSANPELARWLAQTGLVRRLTAVVDNVANGESPRPHLEFLAPKQRFKAARRPPRQIVPDAAGFAGYDIVADVVGSVDVTLAAATYRTLAPLFEAAYLELGHPEGGFPKALDRAVAALVAVPVLGNDVALVPHAVGFRYADAKLEALTAAQKQFLRIGPRNVRIVQQKLRDFATALAVERPASR
jgi:Protein of unknown function (DUF3014)